MTENIVAEAVGAATDRPFRTRLRKHNLAALAGAKSDFTMKITKMSEKGKPHT